MDAKKSGLFVWVSLAGLSSTALAQSSRNLFQDGFAASSYGDVLVDKGLIRKESVSALRLRAGIQIIEAGPVGLTLGYQKVGFYTATSSWDRKSGSLTYDYHGPVAELHLFPRALFSLSVAASTNKGFVFREEGDPTLFTGNCGEACTVLAERSSVKVTEYTAQLGWTVSPQLQLTFGGGARNWKAETSYETSQSRASETLYVRNADGDWKDQASFLMLGLRGTTL